MTLEDYFKRHPKLVKDKRAFLEKKFLEKVFYPEFGDDGLEYLDYQRKVYDNDNKCWYYIDFVVRTGKSDQEIAIELDGYNYHGRMSRSQFERQENRSNAISKKGFRLLRYSYNKVNKHPDDVRRELRECLNEYEVFKDAKSDISNRIKEVVKSEIRPLKNEATRVVRILLMLLVLYLGSQLITFISQKSAQENSEQNNKAQLDDFLDKYEHATGLKVSDLQGYEYGNSKMDYHRFAMDIKDMNKAYYGKVQGGELWIGICSPNEKSDFNFRVYMELNDYEQAAKNVKDVLKLADSDITENDLNKIGTHRGDAFLENMGKEFVFIGKDSLSTEEKWRIIVSRSCGDWHY